MRTHFRNIRGGRASSPSGADAGQGALGFFRRYSGGGRSPQKSPCASPRISEQGSALLIVLGFLSFMMISAVSFAVYMRIERQASSNYRHATAARHLLTAGLFRAIDEIDAELRVPEIKGMVRPRKFPDWQGRVRASAVPNGEKNTLDARVLSMEALSFIPGLLVNDVRRYAIPNQDDQRDSLNTTWCGAKWRTISMPGNVMGSDGDLVTAGRYAYVCINVSDMLDVNVCRAASRDSVSNRVSIGHLFANDGARDAFDASFKTTDKHYDSLQDFYACMYKRDTTFGSPFHEYLNAGNSVNADAGFDEADNHILVTDGIVKPEPTRSATPCNILAKTGQPIDAATLNQTRSPNAIDLQLEFQNALINALGGVPIDGKMMASMIADYIDTDSIPKWLNLPSVEMVPMISQILVPPMFMPIIDQKADPAADPKDTEPTIITYLDFMPKHNMSDHAYLDVEVVWPFKNVKDRTCPSSSDYTVEIVAYTKVNKVHAVQNSNSFQDTPSEGNGYLKWTGNQKVLDFSGKDDTVQAECYQKVKVDLKPQPWGAQKTTIDIINSKGVTLTPGFAVGSPISVSLIVFARVKIGSVYVDSAPQVLPYPNALGSDEDEFATTKKLFFQTVQSIGVDKTEMGKKELAYEWMSLEVPDPRFNYKAANWVKSSGSGATIPNKDINPSTLELLGEEGRDGDIFMSVADSGTLQSPGELGFIVRPFSLALEGNTVDFRNQDSAAKAEDKDAMFRTIRLYDHGDLKRDRVYDYFTVRNPDGTLAGARVNPLSELPQVLAAAVQRTPVDSYWAGANLLPGARPPSATIRNNVFDNAVNYKSSWTAFTNGWFKCLVNATKNVPPAQNINTSLKNNLSDLYGEQAWFGWYSKKDSTTIFDGVSSPGKVSGLSSPLHEIDRKMLFSFTLDSFSDRQQLFLYILRAEATVPNFGGSTDGGVKSLAGGRAVALVWRDPYPEGYKKGTGNDSWLNQGSRMWTQSDHAESGSAARVSPWYQYNILSDKPSKDDGDEDGTFDPRLDGYHQQRILYFKQLNN
jgi:hypothetical protein